MNYKLTPNNQALIIKTETLAREERRITVELIQCLEDISRKMIYAEMGFGSLHEFCTKHLKMSDGSAQRRIAAMRLSRDVPTVKQNILNGELSLSNAAKIQVETQKVLKSRKTEDGQRLSFEKIKTEKSEIVAACLNLSQRECERKLFAEIPELKEYSDLGEKLKLIDETRTELKLILNAELKQKIEELQNLLSHVDPQKSYIKLLERLVDQELTKQRKRRMAKVVAVPQLEYSPTHSAAERGPIKTITQKRRHIPVDVQRLVWLRAKEKCQYPGCNAKYQLQIEHIIPVAQGGNNEPDNLLLLCGTHNLLRARKIFGVEKMQKYVPSLK